MMQKSAFSFMLFFIFCQLILPILIMFLADLIKIAIFSSFCVRNLHGARSHLNQLTEIANFVIIVGSGFLVKYKWLNLVFLCIML